VPSIIAARKSASDSVSSWAAKDDGTCNIKIRNTGTVSPAITQDRVFMSILYLWFTVRLLAGTDPT